MVSDLRSHYVQLLGLTDPWTITNVDIDHDAMVLTIHVSWPEGISVPCPTCGVARATEDHREIRSWRHLDTMQFRTILTCRVPRSRCPDHGVKTIAVPWAGTSSRFTLLFERFAVDVLASARNLTAACAILRVSWDQAQLLMEHAVARGLSRRDCTGIRYVGLDEKSFGKGHSYGSLATDLDAGRVLDVVQGRTREAADALWAAIPAPVRSSCAAIALDMWEPFMDASRAAAPQADLVHDKFHVSGYLGKGVDLVRRQEHRSLRSEGSDLLTGTKYLYLRNPDAWNAEERAQFRTLRKESLKTGRAWAIKESFRVFWAYRSETWARKFFDRWYFWATHSRLRPIIAAAKTLKRHLVGILAYLRHRITNAVTEGLNSKIQSLKANARGFRNFAHYRVAILFHCGKLNLYP